MVLFYVKYFTPFDTIFNKFKRHGFWIYAGIIVASTVYLIFSPSHFPALPPPPSPSPKKSKPSIQPLAKVEESTSIQSNNRPNVQKNGDKPAHVVDTWTKRDLYRFLFKQKIYPEINEDITVIRSKVIAIYDSQLKNEEVYQQ
ncbi:hypothetical protein DFJ63DRAFT_312415 [Scheffersomyces coipomensis]|uniref:uncharacterized protein n=1 Tax=Scheffersomyces coipomensis TaxID=1788519 RepID=UPI00315DA981